MSATLEDLKRAEDKGVLHAGQAGLLWAYLVRDETEPETDVPTFEETETPHFIKGFHDLLVAIGVLIVLIGISGSLDSIQIYWIKIPSDILDASTISLLVLGVVTWVGVEFLARRKRLALASFVLTIAFAWVIAMLNNRLMVEIASFDFENGRLTYLIAGFYFILLSIGSAIFFWRFRVPIGLALWVISAFAGFYCFVLYLIAHYILPASSIHPSPVTVSGLAFVIAFLVFLIALRLDISEMKRKTVQYDYAFWLHLLTAPILIYSLIFFLRAPEDLYSSNVSLSVFDAKSAGITLLVTVIFSILAVLIDRRALITSGLISLGGAIGYLVSINQFTFSQNLYLTLFWVGAFVLLVGLGWHPIRRWMIGLLPHAIQKRVPPPI